MFILVRLTAPKRAAESAITIPTDNTRCGVKAFFSRGIDGRSCGGEWTPSFDIVNTNDWVTAMRHVAKSKYVEYGGRGKKKARRDEKNDTMVLRLVYFFLAAFSADFVTFPPDLSVLSTDLMIPTATVCLMSRTAKRPRGGYSL